MHGSTASARCPSHEDRSPSLSLRLAGDRVLMLCRAGCVTADVLAVLGLRFSDLRKDTGPQPFRVPRRRRVVNPWLAHPWSDLIPDPAHWLRRMAAEHDLEADPAYWLRRAETFDAVPLPEVADACRRHAALLSWSAGEPLSDPVRPW